MRTRRVLRMQSLLFVALLLVIVGLLGWLSTRYVYQQDWTASGRNTLSEASISLLSEIPGEVVITAYAREAPPLLRERISDLVDRYQRHKSDITLTFINPDRRPQLARELNVANGEMVIEYEGREERLREPTETGLTNALERLGRGERRLLFLAGHGERDPQGGGDHDYANWSEQLRSRGFEIDIINLLESPEIPADTAALVIAAPQSDLLPGEVSVIGDYLTAGGNLLWLTEPDGGRRGLGPVAQQLGLTFRQGTIVDPTVSQVGVMLFGLDDPRIALVASYPSHPITRTFDRNTLFPVAGAIELESDAGRDAVPVLKTLSGTWLESGVVQGTVTYDEGVDLQGPLTVGVAISRVQDPPQSEGGAAADASPSDQRIFVAADSDFLSNGFLGMAGNLQLGLNIVNWLAHDDRFIEIPARTAPDLSLEFTPLTTAIVGFGFLLVLPLLLLGSGLTIWMRRRRR